MKKQLFIILSLSRIILLSCSSGDKQSDDIDLEIDETGLEERPELEDLEDILDKDTIDDESEVIEVD